MLLLAFLLLANIVAASVKTVGDYSVTIHNNMLTRVFPRTSINRDLDKKLNLSNLHISSIAQGAFLNISNIETLDLSTNDISTLHRGVFSNLRHLNHLSLASNVLKNFYKAFEGLEHLRSLDISNSCIRRLGNSDFFGIPKSANINTAGNKLETISRALFEETYASSSVQAILCQHEGIVSSLEHWANTNPLPTGCVIVQIGREYPQWLRLDHLGISGFDKDWYRLYNTKVYGLNLRENNIVDITPEFVNCLPYHLTHLDLSKNKIERVTRGVIVLRNLVWLKLSGNLISDVAIDAFKHTSLEHLILDNNRLSNVHFVPTLPSNLSNLYLQNNQISDLDPAPCFSTLHELIVLNLAQNKITELKKEHFIGLESLLTLTLRGNVLKNIDSDCFDHVPNLLQLNLDHNNLTKWTGPDITGDSIEPILLCMSDGIVTAVRQMTEKDTPMPEQCDEVKLEERRSPLSEVPTLNLKRKGITGFAKNWYLLRIRVTTIILDSNAIVDVTSEMFNDLPKNVSYIYMRNNKIERLKQGVIVNEHLRILNLDGNVLRTIEEDALVNTKLSELTLSSNQLKGTRFVAGLPSSLIKLDVSSNTLEEIPAGTFSRLNNLKFLYINHAYLKNIGPESFSGLSSLKTLSLERNKLTTIDKDAFQHTKILEELVLYGNKLQSMDKLLFSNLDQLSHINLRYNQIENITKDTLPDFPHSLESLDLRHNLIRHIEAGSFVGGPKYKLLLQHNNLTTINEGVFILPDLVVLHLENNQLNQLNGEAFKTMPNLEELYLNVNRITKIDKGAAKYLNKLYMLDLSRNPIKALNNGDLFGLSNLPSQKYDALIRVVATPLQHIGGSLFNDESGVSN